MELTLEHANGSGTGVPEAPRTGDERALLAGIRQELDGYYRQVKTYPGIDPAEVLLSISAISGRLTELRGHIQRSASQRFQAVRTKEIDPLIDELDRQFRVHSRLQAIRQHEWEITRGSP